MSPALVGADAEQGEVEPGERVERVCRGRVPGEEGAGVAVLDEIRVVAAPAVERVACAPVIRFECGDAEASNAECAVPGEFDDASESPGEEPARAASGDDGGVRVGEGFEGGKVEMIEVGVGEEDDVDASEGRGWDGGVLEAGRADGASDEARADAMVQHGVGEDRGLGKTEKGRGVAEPAGGESSGRQERGGGVDFRGDEGGGVAEGLGDLAGVAAQLRPDGAGTLADSVRDASLHGGSSVTALKAGDGRWAGSGDRAGYCRQQDT